MTHDIMINGKLTSHLVRGVVGTIYISNCEDVSLSGNSHCAIDGTHIIKRSYDGDYVVHNDLEINGWCWIKRLNLI